MNKIIYIIMNSVAMIIALSLLIFANGLLAKLFGLVGIIYILKELISGSYKKYIN